MGRGMHHDGPRTGGRGMAIVSTKEAEHFRTAPGGYFDGLVAKAITGELHLERTVWALRLAAEPERRERGRGGGSARRQRDWSP